MLVAQEIKALRNDDASQRQAQARLAAAVERWRTGPRFQPFREEMEQLAQGKALAAQANLAQLFDPTGGATPGLAADLAAGLVDLIAAELKEFPLVQSPLRHFADGAVSSLLVAQVGTVALMIQAVDGPALMRRQPVQTTSFTAGETWDHVLTGTAEAELVQIIGSKPGGVELRKSECCLVPGAVSFRDGSRESLLIRKVSTCLVTLKLQRRLGQNGVVRQFRLDDGSLVHLAAGSSRESRLELAAALLGRMGRRDAAPLMAAMAEEQGPQSLRWQSLRECIALDSASGFATLCRIAAKADDPLAMPAGAMRAQLLESYPQLGEFDQCPK